MADDRPILTLAHSGDADDAFMWWPITGKVIPNGKPWPGRGGQPAVDTGRFRYRAVPGDISDFNKLASGAAPYDITALSARAFADVPHRYVVTACGGSFGEGYGPKVVARDDSPIREPRDLAPPSVSIAIPGRRTSAFMTLCLLLGAGALANRARFIEMPFFEIIPALMDRRVDAGLIIHEGQLAFQGAGLRQVVDLGGWWLEECGLPLPLGVNAVKLDVDKRFGDGAMSDILLTLSRSISFAREHPEEGVEYTLMFAQLNAARSRLAPLSRDTIVKYLNMYVTDLTVNMGERGRRALRYFYEQGAAAGLCPPVPALFVF